MSIILMSSEFLKTLWEMNKTENLEYLSETLKRLDECDELLNEVLLLLMDEHPLSLNGISFREARDAFILYRVKQLLELEKATV